MQSTDDPLAGVSQWEVWGLVWLSYLSVMGLVVLIYDWLLTLDDEMRLVWPGPHSLPKSLYYINRYLSIVISLYANYRQYHILFGWWTRALKDYQRFPVYTHHSPIICQISVWVTGIPFVVIKTASTAMLCLRVVALYGGVRWVTCSVWICFVVLHGLRMMISLLGSMAIYASVKYSPIGGQCLWVFGALMTSSAPTYLYITAPTILDLFLLVLTIVKAFRSSALSKSHPSSPIMRALLRHELLYFIIIAITRSWITVAVVTFPISWVNTASTVEWGVETTLISRFFLNLRAIYYYDKITPVNQTVVSTLVSPIRTHPFRRRPRRLTTAFSYGFRTGASTYGDLATQTERGIPPAEPVDLDTRQDSDKDDIRLENFTVVQK